MRLQENLLSYEALARVTRHQPASLLRSFSQSRGTGYEQPQLFVFLVCLSVLKMYLFV